MAKIITKSKKSAAGRKKIYTCNTKQVPYNLPINAIKDAGRLIKELRKLYMVSGTKVDMNVINNIFEK
jgi:hypothetical protein